MIERIARLLLLTPLEARALLAVAARGTATLRILQVDLALSAGGAVALAQRLEREALVRREADPDRPLAVRLRLTPGAERELEAALTTPSTRPRRRGSRRS